VKSIKFVVPGKPVPYVRTTQKQKYYDKQWARYSAYCLIVQISYFLAVLESKYASLVICGGTSIMSAKESLTRYRAQLMAMIGTATTSAHIEIIITAEKNKRILNDRIYQ